MPGTNSVIPVSQQELIVSATGDTASPTVAAEATKEHYLRGIIVFAAAAGTITVTVGSIILIETLTLTAGQLLALGGLNIGTGKNAAITVTGAGLGATGWAKTIHTTVPG